MNQLKCSLPIVTVVLCAGCVVAPTGPTIGVMPAPNKPFPVFQQDQSVCEQYASDQVAGGAAQANNQEVETAVIGTALGAGLGAAVGGGRGAAVGAGTGAVVGTAVGAQPEGYAQWNLQQRYNYAYAQCMYAKGNQVPGYPVTAPPPPPPLQ